MVNKYGHYTQNWTNAKAGNEGKSWSKKGYSYSYIYKNGERIGLKRRYMGRIVGYKNLRTGRWIHKQKISKKEQRYRERAIRQRKERRDYKSSKLVRCPRCQKGFFEHYGVDVFKCNNCNYMVDTEHYLDISFMQR